MTFQRSRIDFGMQDRTKICLKIASKMTCFNLPPARYENPAQGAPKTPQDAPGWPKRRLKIPPKHPQETPRRAKDASQGVP